MNFMKKALIIISAFIFSSQSGYSQTRYNGYLIGKSPDNSTVKYQFTNDTTGSFITGKVGIGTASIPAGYMLAVDGTAIFTKARVNSSYSSWPDFVFNDNYSLLPINDLENYIKINKHLPDVPSATDVKTNGIDLGDNQAMLLKKIEELALYIIDQNKVALFQDKKIESQNAKFDKQALQIRELEKQNQQLQKLLQDQIDELKNKINTIAGSQ
jgi:hypothetical protein